MWLSVINLFIFLLFDWILTMWQVLINAAFYGYACVDFYTYGAKASRFLKGILVSVASYFAFMFIGMIAAMIYLFSNPEMLETLRQSRE